MNGISSRALRSQRGQSTVELALCLPILAAVMAAVVEICLLAGDQVRLWHAAREAARVAVVDSGERSVRAAAERSGLQKLELSLAPAAAYRVQGRPLTVSLAYEPQGRVPLIGELVSLLELKARATMRIEEP
jgi:Flp pilus assembly protein TadG